MDPQDTAISEDGAIRAFPGGAVRLPRISRPLATDTDAAFDAGEFGHQPLDPWPSATPIEGTGFGQYYSTESLFCTTNDVVDGCDRNDGPYAVLGLTPDDSWEDISRSHRRLVSELHPDRFVGADDVVRDAAERRVRDVNEAYSEIRRERAGRGL